MCRHLYIPCRCFAVPREGTWIEIIFFSCNCCIHSNYVAPLRSMDQNTKKAPKIRSLLAFSKIYEGAFSCPSGGVAFNDPLDRIECSFV